LYVKYCLNFSQYKYPLKNCGKRIYIRHTATKIPKEKYMLITLLFKKYHLFSTRYGSLQLGEHAKTCIPL
jgi:hypothetical protein